MFKTIKLLPIPVKAGSGPAKKNVIPPISVPIKMT
jgi:hypothetical protein